MNEAEDDSMTIGFQYMLLCGHSTDEDSITMNGKLTVLADPIKTLKEMHYCKVCEDYKVIQELRIYWKYEEDEERQQQQQKEQEERTVVHAN